MQRVAKVPPKIGALATSSGATVQEDQQARWWKHACAASSQPALKELSLRPVEDRDTPFLRALYATTRIEELGITCWSDQEHDRFLASQFEMQHRYYSQHYGDADFLLLCRLGQPIGRLYWLEQAAAATLLDISLLPNERGHGLGTALLLMMGSRADALGLPIWLHVDPSNPAMSLYLRLGFLLVDGSGIYTRMRRQATSKRPVAEWTA